MMLQFESQAASTELCSADLMRCWRTNCGLLTGAPDFRLPWMQRLSKNPASKNKGANPTAGLGQSIGLLRLIDR
jgi:hypothetical protein